MPLATTLGREHALAQLQARRLKNKDKTRFDNSSLPAGSPMYFDCLTCGETISVPEDYITRPKLCPECQALKDCGWLDQRV